MNGPGFLIWKLKTLLPIEKAIADLKTYGVKWVSIKFLDGTIPYNLIDATGNYTGKKDFLKYAIEKFREAGIEVGGWHFLYTSNAVNPIRQAEEANKVMREYGLSHWLVDAEEVQVVTAFWKTGASRKADATNYMNSLNVDIPVALCSYRYPSMHYGFPFKEFVNHSRNTFIAQQLYWLFSSNPAFQLRKSLGEYNAMRKLSNVPIGVAYREHGWEPTVDQIKEFVKEVKDIGLAGWGFWVLDQTILRPDWMSVISGNFQDTPPILPPAPPPAPTTKTVLLLKVGVDSLRVRNAIIPSVKYPRPEGSHYSTSTTLFTLTKGSVIEVLEEIVDGHNIWVRVGQRQFVAKKYDDVNYLV